MSDSGCLPFLMMMLVLCAALLFALIPYAVLILVTGLVVRLVTHSIDSEAARPVWHAWGIGAGIVLLLVGVISGLSVWLPEVFGVLPMLGLIAWWVVLFLRVREQIASKGTEDY